MNTSTTPPPEPAQALTELADAVHRADAAGELRRLFDAVDANVRSQIKAGHLKLPTDVELDDYVLDLVSETLAHARDIAHKYTPTKPVVEWLIRVGMNVLLSRSRDGQRDRERLRDPGKFDVRLIADELPVPEDGDPTDEDLFGLLGYDDQAERIEDRLTSDAVLGGLEEPHADVLRRRYLLDQDVEEIAEAYDLSVDAVYARLSRARTAAKKSFD